MIKPSGQRYLNEIFEMIKRDLKVIEAYHIPDWKSLVEQLYLPEIQKYGDEFAEDFDIHIWINNYFFGNQAILLKVTTYEDKLLEEILTEIHRKKKEIRQTFNCTKNGTSMFLINVNMLNIKHNLMTINGTVCLQNNSQINELDCQFLQKNGRYKTQFLNYVHACNPNIAAFQHEVKIYSEFKIFQNSLTQYQLEQCIKMKSCSRPL